MNYSEAYEIGKRAKAKGYNSFDEAIMYGEVDLWGNALLAFCEHGFRGLPMPKSVTAWRYGRVPTNGMSYNYRDDYQEAGCSVMAVDGGPETQDKISALFIANGRPVIKVQGYLHGFRTGSDGEPLLIAAREIK